MATIPTMPTMPDRRAQLAPAAAAESGQDSEVSGLPNFAAWPTELRPAWVEAEPHRARPQQVAAWRRLGALLYDLTTARAIEARRLLAEPDVCDDAAAEAALFAAEGDESDEEVVR